MKYIDGNPFRKIADHMNAQESPYNAENTRWNKNMVARIIGCEAHLGKSGLSVIITDEEYQMAMSAKQSRTLVGRQDATAKCIRRLSRCSSCGGELRIRDERWKCKQCDALTYKAKTPAVMEQCREICTNSRRVSVTAFIHCAIPLQRTCLTLERRVSSFRRPLDTKV